MVTGFSSPIIRMLDEEFMLLINAFHGARPWTPMEVWIILLLAGAVAGVMVVVFFRCRVTPK